VSVAAVVVAGGRGERFGGPKQFARIGSSTVAARSVTACRCVAEMVVLVVPDNYAGDGEGADVIVTGGATRSASVRAGLERVGDAEIVVIHDAARPLASEALFHAVVDQVRVGAPGAVPGVAVADTIKRVDGDLPANVVETLERDRLVAVQTPQAFRLDRLVAAHAGEPEATDDAALLERAGDVVVVVAGEPTNTKITTPDDLARIAANEGT
jgi:2-C-methyl-D-erythritol 4-phosphate cytidylyltransferase